MKRAAIALVVGISTASTPLALAQSGFVDLDEAPAHRPAVEAIGHLGISDGAECAPDRFCPTDSLQRWVLAVWLVRILDREVPRSSSNRFADVDPDQWWAPYVERLAALGITVGCSVEPARYCPGDSVTRGQMATFLTRAFHLPPAPSFGFADTEENPHQTDIDSLAAARITVGCATEPARYCPGDSVTRGQMATFLIRAISTTAVWVRPKFPAAPATGPWINTWDREAVVAASRAEFYRTEPDPEFTGAISACDPGTTGQVFRQSVMSRVNWYRRMAGLHTVTERPEYSSRAQHAALIMASNQAVSHYPSDDWECVTPDGRLAARKSNLHWGGSAGVYAIDSYVISMRHRRWILFPQLLEVGTGDVGTANALYVIGDRNNPTPEVREPTGFVAWPPAGYVPAGTVSGFWSFDLRDASFADAAVAVIDEAGPLPVRIVDREEFLLGGIVWEYADRSGSFGNRSGWAGKVSDLGFETEERDKCYTITISNVTVGGAVVDPYRYQTCVITLTPEN